MRKGFKKGICTLLVAGLAVLSLAGCGGSKDASVDKVKKAGVLRVGVKEATLGFGYLNPTTGSYEGLEIDLAKKMAEDLGVKVEFTSVNASTRGQLLDAGELDMVAATFTITEERRLSYDFSTSYYTDYVSVLVRNDSGIETLEDFEGKTIAVVTGSVSKKNVESATSANIKFVEYPEYSDCKLAVASGTADGFAVDVSVLSIWVDDDCHIISARFAPQEYGVATKKGCQFSEYVDGKIKEWLADGTIASLIEKNGIK